MRTITLWLMSRAAELTEALRLSLSSTRRPNLASISKAEIRSASLRRTCSASRVGWLHLRNQMTLGGGPSVLASSKKSASALRIAKPFAFGIFPDHEIGALQQIGLTQMNRARKQVQKIGYELSRKVLVDNSFKGRRACPRERRIRIRRGNRQVRVQGSLRGSGPGSYPQRAN